MEPILQVSHLTKSYPAFLLKDISFTMRPGSIMGLIGSKGAGKTTLIKAMLGLVRPAGGSVRFFGEDYLANQRELRQRLGFYSGELEYYPKKRVRDLIAVSREFYERWDEPAFRRYLQVFRIDDTRPIGELDGLKRARLAIAEGLSHAAELLLLDEPTSGLDPAARDELIEDIRFLKRQGISVFFSSHYTYDLEKCADDISYLRDGELLASEALVDFISFRRQLGFGSSLERIMIHYERGAWNDAAGQ